jgi:hypothetical protein
MSHPKHREIAEEHLPYEIGMLVFSALVYQNMGTGGPHPDIERAVRNALITAFCIHARNLIDFLESKRKGARARKMAVDYKPFANGKIDKRLTKKLEDQIAHLSFGRTSNPNEKINGRDRTNLLRAIVTELIAYRPHLRPEYQHSPWNLEINDETVRLTLWRVGAELDRQTTRLLHRAKTRVDEGELT